MLFGFAVQARSTDTLYIRKFSRKFSVKATVEANRFRYSLTPLNVPGFSKEQLEKARINAMPYIPFSTSLSVGFGWLSLSHTFQFTNTYFNKSNRQETDFRNYELTYHGKIFCAEAYYQDYKQLYYNTGSDTRIAAATLGSDLRYFQFGMRTFFIFKGSRYSYNAAFNQSQFQVKSAGSFMLLTSFNYNQLKADSDAVGRTMDSLSLPAPAYSAMLGLSRNSQMNFNIMPGYGYTLVHRRLYLALAQYIGTGIQAQNYKIAKDASSNLALALVGRSKAALGFNGRKIYGGLYFNSDMTRSKTPSRFLTFENIYNSGVFLGFRIIKEKRKK